MLSESRTLDSKVAAEIGLSHIYMLDLDINIVHLAIALLRSDKFATGPQKGGSVIWQKLRAISRGLVAQAGEGSGLTRTLENSQLRSEELDCGNEGDWLRMHVDSAGDVARMGSGSSSTIGASFSAFVGVGMEPSSDRLRTDGSVERSEAITLMGSLDSVSRQAFLSGSGQVRVEMASIGVLLLGVGMADQGSNNRNIELYDDASNQNTSEREKKVRRSREIKISELRSFKALNAMRGPVGHLLQRLARHCNISVM